MGIYTDTARKILQDWDGAPDGVGSPSPDREQEISRNDEHVVYSIEERRFLADAPVGMKATVDAIKTAFADVGGATVVEVKHADPERSIATDRGGRDCLGRCDSCSDRPYKRERINCDRHA